MEYLGVTVIQVARILCSSNAFLMYLRKNLWLIRSTLVCKAFVDAFLVWSYE